MDFSEFLKGLPEVKRALYQKVYDSSLTNEKNPALAKKLNVSLNQIETVRGDLIQKGWITPKRIPYRKKAGLPPIRKLNTASKKKNHGFYRTAGLKPGQIRHTFIIDSTNLENIQLLAHLDQKKLNVFVNDLFTEYFCQRKSDLNSAIGYRNRIINLRISNTGL